MEITIESRVRGRKGHQTFIERCIIRFAAIPSIVVVADAGMRLSLGSV